MTIRSLSIRTALWAACLLAFSVSAGHATDGVMEINHVCAGVGCFTGDAAGYPVSISTPGSYRLTGDLTPSGGQDALDVSGPDVTIDLNGFRLVGTGSGTGVSADAADYLTVRNGTVRSFDVGLEVGDHPRLENLNVYGCTYEGIITSTGGFLRGNQVVDNGAEGITLNPTAAFGENVASGNSPDVNGGGTPLAANNYCEDGSCSTRARMRRYYLTSSLSDGSAAKSACEAGFHFASRWEISEPSNLLYGNNTGLDIIQSPDGGPGPRAGLEGWIRTGHYHSPSWAGAANCGTWSSNNPGVDGTQISLSNNWSSTTLKRANPWEATVDTCDSPSYVWCVED